MFFIAYTFKGQVLVFAGQVKIVSHWSCRTSAIFKYFCPLYCSVFHNRIKTEQCVLYHCSVFALLFRFWYDCSVFPQYNKNGTVYFVPLSRFYTTARFFTTEQKRISVFCTTVPFCSTVPFFATLFRFPRWNKNGTVYLEPLFRVFVPLFRFSTTVPFFLNRTKKEQCVFVPLFRFCTSVPFSHNRTKMDQCILYHCSVFSYHCSGFCTTVPFFHNGTKTEQCILYHCSVFLYYCSVFAPLFRFCTSVHFFALLFRFFHNGTKNLIVYFVPLFRVYVPLFRFSTTVPFFPQIEGTSHSVSRRQRNETFPNRKGNK